jgi:hypothetical protein
MDIEVIQRKTKLEIVTFSVKAIFNPPILDVKGVRGFFEIDSVIVNGQSSTKVSVLSDTRALVELPVGVTEIFSLDVLSSNSQDSNQFLLESGMRKKPVLTSGVSRVIQKVVKVLLTRPGSDIFNPALGGGLQQLVAGAGASHGDLSSALITTIKASENSIIKSEMREDMPNSDKLGSISISEITPLEKSGVSLNLEITNKDGDTGKASVSI